MKRIRSPPPSHLQLAKNGNRRVKRPQKNKEGERSRTLHFLLVTFIAFLLCIAVVLLTTLDRITVHPESTVPHGPYFRVKATNNNIPPSRNEAKRTHLLNTTELQASEELIDMRQLSFELPFDDPDGGAWKQGWDVQPSSKPLKIFVVPHSHCDPGWIKTFDEYFRQQTTRIITTVIDSLLQDRRRTFIWAEISYFSWWYEEQSASRKVAVQQLLDNKQLEFVTGGWVQPDEANSELYAMEIQLREGHDWIRNNLGEQYLPQYSWSIDPFGYSPTAAYLWKRYNMKGMLIQRVHYAVKKELAKHQHLEFFWRQTWDEEHGFDPINGQDLHSHDMFTHVMPFFSYDVPHTCGPDPATCCQFDFARLSDVNPRMTCPWHSPPQRITNDNVHQRASVLLDQYRKKAALYRSNAVLIPLGDDFRWQTQKEADAQYQNYQKLIDYINEQYDDVEIRFGTLSDYMEAARESFHGKIPVLKGSFFTYADVKEDYWSGYFSSRIFDKALDRHLERILFAAESLGADAKALEMPRRALSLFQHHDGVTGTAKNEVVEDYARRMQEAIRFTHDWILKERDELKNLQYCLFSNEPRELMRNQCEESVVVYNPIETPQSCGSVVVPGRSFANAVLPCEQPGGSLSGFGFDGNGLVTGPIKEEWKFWSVRKGGAYLFFPGTLNNYDLEGHNLKISHEGFVVETEFWKRTAVERQVPPQFDSATRVIDFIYEIDLREGNQEWFARFRSDIRNDGYFYTDLNGFNFDTHRFRSDLPIQSQVFPMPTLASIQDNKTRMTVISEHAQGSASLDNGSIDVWLDRRLNQDDNRGLGQGVKDNRPTRTRFRVVLEHGTFDTSAEFDVSPVVRHFWDELQHPLEIFGTLSDAIMAERQLVHNKQSEGKKADPLPQGDRRITRTDHTFENTVVPFVFLVFKRVDYFRSVIESLRNSDFPRDWVPIVISIDGHVPEMLEYVESLKGEFKVIQLVHPFSCYDHPHSFPGDDPKLNEGYKGDAYGNPRDWRVTCCKHHFAWLMRHVFSLEAFENVDTFMFLEEDYVVAPTIYHAIANGLNAMDEFESETAGGFLGLGFEATPKRVDTDAWYGGPFITGPMTLHRSTFGKVQTNAKAFCGLDDFDDYNWDWTFVHMQIKGMIPHTLLYPSQPLVRHIGIDGGMHKHEGREVDPKLDSTFVGTKIHGIPKAQPKKAPGFGGWGHSADQTHCLKVLTGDPEPDA